MAKATSSTAGTNDSFKFTGGMSNPFQSFDWYFTGEQVQNSPSRKDGFSLAEENENRRSTCGFIQEVGMKLKMPQYTIATAIVYFHRFFMRHSMKHYDRHLVGTACLFLSGKAEETPRKLKDAVSMGYQMKYPERPPLKPDSEDMMKRQETIVMVEREVLKAILFNMKVDHPYQELIKTVKQMKGQRELAQVAWNLVNDSLRTTCCLRFKPKMVAIASIYLASKMINQNIQLETVPNLKVEQLEEIGMVILDLYDNKNSDDPKHAAKHPLSKQPPKPGSLPKPDSGTGTTAEPPAKKPCPPPPKPAAPGAPAVPKRPPPPASSAPKVKAPSTTAPPPAPAAPPGGESTNTSPSRGTKRPLEDT